MNVTPPASEQELVERAQALAGLSLRELAERCNVPVPPDLRRAKGFVGGLVERVVVPALGRAPYRIFRSSKSS